MGLKIKIPQVLCLFPNFISDKFIKQTDGAIYWKLTEGRTPMASYKESLTDEQRWQLVNYIKSLKK